MSPPSGSKTALLVFAFAGAGCVVDTETGAQSEDVSEAPSVPSYVDAGEASCREERRRNVDWSSGFHDGCSKGGYTMYGSFISSCPQGSEYVVVYGPDRCMKRVEPLVYAPAGAPLCAAGERWTDVMNGIGDRCCVPTEGGWRCDALPVCEEGILLATRGDDACLATEDKGEIVSVGPAACPQERPVARVDLRHPTLDNCCTAAGECRPLVAIATCPDKAVAVSLVGPDACMTSL